MLTGEIRSQIDTIWNTFWTGGISNPLEVIEQITYLLFLRRLDELQTVEELKAAREKKPAPRTFYPNGTDPRGIPFADLRWQSFKNKDAREMFTLVSDSAKGSNTRICPKRKRSGGTKSNGTRKATAATAWTPKKSTVGYSTKTRWIRF